MTMFYILFENLSIYSSLPVLTVADLPRWPNAAFLHVKGHIFLSYGVLPFTAIVYTFQKGKKTPSSLGPNNATYGAIKP